MSQRTACEKGGHGVLGSTRSRFGSPEREAVVHRLDLRFLLVLTVAVVSSTIGWTVREVRAAEAR